MDQITYRDDSLILTGELSQPLGQDLKRGALLLHEADGIGGNVRRRAALLAERGYTVLAADIHGAGRTLSAEEIPAAMAAFRADPAMLRKRVRAGLDALCAAARIDHADVIVIGYCFGGMAALELARDGAPVAAVVSFHGLLTTIDPAGEGAVACPVFASTGSRDPLVPPDDLAAFQSEMDAAGADWRMIVHGGALHSFTNRDVDGIGDPRMAYDAVADAESWAAMLDFVERAFI